jgi:hypothetical protein
MFLMVDTTKGVRQRRAYITTEPAMLQVMPDTGCPDISDSCLECPLPWCLWDYPPKDRVKVKRRFLESKLQ